MLLGERLGVRKRLKVVSKHRSSCSASQATSVGDPGVGVARICFELGLALLTRALGAARTQLRERARAHRGCRRAGAGCGRPPAQSGTERALRGARWRVVAAIRLEPSAAPPRSVRALAMSARPADSRARRRAGAARQRWHRRARSKNHGRVRRSARVPSSCRSKRGRPSGRARRTFGRRQARPRVHSKSNEPRRFAPRFLGYPDLRRALPGRPPAPR